MDDTSYNVRIPKRWVRTALVVAVTALIVAPLTAIATDAFTDVPASNTHHNDIAWLKDAGVTKGCNPPDNDRYCPSDFVTRAQMATFMRNLASNKVVDAGTLEGKTASQLQNTALLATNSGFVNLPGGATTEVHSLDLAAGTYLVSARGQLNNNAGSTQQASCSLAAGGASVSTGSTIQLGANQTAGSRENWSLFLVAQLPSSGPATISCSTSAGFSGNLIAPQIAALAVDTATVAGFATNSDGNPDG